MSESGYLGGYGPPPDTGEFGEPLALWSSLDDLMAAVPTLDDDAAQMVARTATDVLYALSGRRFPGLRVARLAVAPTTTGYREPLPTSVTPWGGPVSSLRRCGCCSGVLDPLLHPIRRVLRVTVGDIDVPLEQVDASDGRTIRIVRGTVTDPLAVNYWCGPDGLYSLFPGSGACGAAPVEVVFEWGRDVPDGGRLAARLFAEQLGKAAVGDTSCRLPGNVVSTSRQGVSVVLDPSKILEERRTGLQTVDAWIASVNPNRLTAEPQLWWPGAPLPTRVG